MWDVFLVSVAVLTIYFLFHFHRVCLDGKFERRGKFRNGRRSEGKVSPLGVKKPKKQKAGLVVTRNPSQPALAVTSSSLAASTSFDLDVNEADPKGSLR